MPTPNWQAARNGFPGDSNAVDKSAQVNQFLGTHTQTTIYAGNQILTPQGFGAGTDDPANFWIFHLDQFDYDQLFTLSGTSIGRVMVPVLPVGTGADLQVSLYTDSAGSPGTLLNQVTIPAKWIISLAGTAAAAGPSTSCLLRNSASPLATQQFNTLQFGAWTQVNWASPAGLPTGSGAPTSISDGNFVVMVGGADVNSNPLASVFTSQYSGGTALNLPQLQPALPQATDTPYLGIVNGTIIVAGGGITALGANTTAVYTASWDRLAGVIGQWTAQANLPVAISTGAGVAGTTSGGTDVMYVIGGLNSSGSTITTVYWAAVQNGQIGSWNTASPLPWSAELSMAAILGSGAVSTCVFARINSDGSLGPWLPGPTLPVASGSSQTLTTDDAMVLLVGYTNPSNAFSNAVQMITWDANGPSRTWNQQTWPVHNQVLDESALFSVGAAQWQAFGITPTLYETASLYGVPYISVPLPTSGLTNNATYHVVLHQVGGDLNNYLRTEVDNTPFTTTHAALYRTRGSGSWTTYFSSYAVPIKVFDQTVAGQPWHTWDDSGARISTLVYATTGDARLLGGLETTQFADGTLLSDAWKLTYPGDASGQGVGTPGALWPPLDVVPL